jgi:hypothetical protein
MWVNFEHEHVITVASTASLIIDKPVTVSSPREHETPERQAPINYDISDLILLSGIGQSKRRLTGNLGKCLPDVGRQTLRCRDHFESTIESVFFLGYG